MADKYVLRNGQLVSKSTGEPMEMPERDGVCMPRIQSDLPAYRSVVSNKMIDGRADRREDLKRNNCRPVEPDEYTPVCRTEKWAKRLNAPMADLSEKRLTDQI